MSNALSSKLDRCNLVWVVRGSPAKSDAATDDPQLIAPMIECLKKGFATDMRSEVSRQTREAVQGEVNLYRFESGRKIHLVTFRFDSEDLESPRYKEAFIHAVRNISSHGVEMSTYLTNQMAKK